MRLRFLILALLCGSAFGSCTGSSPTWTSTADQASVASCISGASTGDTINVSSGSATWSGLALSKGLTLSGGHGGTTTINGTANTITITGNISAAFRLTGFTFSDNPTGDDSTDTVILNIDLTYKVGRIDHNTFTMTNNGVTMGISGSGGLLIDHNTFTGGGAAEIIHNLGTFNTTSTAFWTDDITPGSPYMVYYETNTFTCTDPSILCKLQESYYGAREVARYNTMQFASFDAHGNSGTPANVGTRWYEIYNNTLNDEGKNQCCGISLRGGSGLVYNNTAAITGGSAMNFQIEEDASCSGSPDSNAYHVGSGILSGPTGANYSTPLYAWNNTNLPLALDSCFTLGNQVKSSGSLPTLTKCESAADVTAGCSNTGAAPTYSYTAFTYPYPLDANGLPNPAGATVSTPVFTPPNGTQFANGQIVTITSSTSGATLCYTTDGTTPAAATPGACSHGTTLSNGGTVTVSSTETIQVLGTESGDSNSSVASASFTVGGAVTSNIDDIPPTSSGSPAIGWATPPYVDTGCGDPTGPTSYPHTIGNTSPSLDGFSSLFTLVSAPEGCVGWFYNAGPQDLATVLTNDFQYYSGSTNSSGNANEFDVYQYVKAASNPSCLAHDTDFYFGTQCVTSTGDVQIWDQGAKAWHNTSPTISCASGFATGAWHHITMNDHWTCGDTSGTGGYPKQCYDTITIDGVQHTINNCYSSGALPGGYTENSGANFELDVGAAGTTLTANLDEATLTFAQNQTTLTVTNSGTGVTTSSPAGISCPGTCSASFSPGTVVTLTAVPGIGQEVNAWADGCSGTGTTCLVTMNANETATIVFSGNALTTSQLANNLTATSTNFSISNGIVTSAATNSFGHYAWLGISRCTTATQLNGQLLFTNGSTTTSSIVGNLYNTQLSVLSPANVSTTADTTCYFQGQGWNAFVEAPFPAPGSTSCTLGNGSPSCALASPTVGPGSNTWAFDPAVPCGSLNGRPCVPIVQMADPSYTSTHAPLVPSLAGETFEQAISLNDGLGDYMFLLTVEGAQEAFSGHIDATHCGGFPCFINDVTSAANAWNATSTLKAFSRNPANNPGPHKALVYGVNTTNPYAPVVESWTLQYASGVVTAISGPNVLFNVDTCPAFGYTTVGTGFAALLTPRVDNFDNIFYFALGSGAQGGPGRHMVFAVALNSGSTPATRTCKSWDTEGTTGSGVSSYQVTTGHGGTTYTNGATVTGVCGDTYTITASGGVVSALAQTAAGSSCYFGAANAMTGGGGTGLEYDITGVGTAGATNLLYAPIASASCPARTTLTCEAPIATTIYAYGIHGGAMLGDGVYAYTSGWGQTADPTRCSACDAVEWSLGSSSSITGTTSGNQNGHESIGFTWIGTASNPTYYQNNIPAGIADPTCSSSSDCYLQFTLASSCSSNPGGSQMHSGVSSLGNQDISATWITSSINTPGTPVQTNPLGTACGLGQNSLFQVDRVIGGATHWLAHHYENGNNYTSGSPPLENFEGADTICAFAPDDAFALCGADQNTNFTGNTGLGADNNGAAFVGTFSYTPPSNLIVIPYPAPLIGLF